MHPFYTYQPDIFSHLDHTRILCSLGQISISFDVLSSKQKWKWRRSISIHTEPLNYDTMEKKATGREDAYRSLCIKIPRGRRHILRNVRVNFLPILVNLSWSKPGLSCFLQFQLLPVIDLSINHLHRLYRIPTWLLRQVHYSLSSYLFLFSIFLRITQLHTLCLMPTE